jgi:hypothetical protein
MDMRMPFGKWRGHLISTIDPGYLRWLLRECDNLDPRLRQAAIDSLLARGEPLEEELRATHQLADMRGVVRSWYRTLALEFHPDRRLDDGRAMVAVNRGHELLKELLELDR